jgi:hypothetical protein
MKKKFHPEKFYPCDPDLADALEAAYDQIKPWDLSYEVSQLSGVPPPT